MAAILENINNLKHFNSLGRVNSFTVETQFAAGKLCFYRERAGDI